MLYLLGRLGAMRYFRLFVILTWVWSLGGAWAQRTPIPVFAGYQGRLTVSEVEVQLWRQRAQSGPYLRLGDAGTNTPGDWQRILQFRDEFVRSPYDSGNSDAQHLDLWTGYSSTIDSLDQYPVWQGIKLQAAAFCYLVEGDTLAGRLAKEVLLRQVRMVPGPGRNGLRTANWPLPGGQKKPNYESGTKECVWLGRLALAYDYVLPLLAPAERAEVVQYLRGSATYFARRAQQRLEGRFPNRARGDYSLRLYTAAPGGARGLRPDPIYAEPGSKNPPAYGSRVYTHVNADGQLGNAIPRLVQDYNNRTAERMAFVLLAGLLAGDDYLVREAKTYQREWLMFSVYPDGTYGEYERNGNYGNPSTGAMWYGALCLQSYIRSADLLSRVGDNSLYTFSTRQGAFNTAVAAGASPKSLRTVLDRYVDNLRGQNPIYHGSVAPDTRIDNYNESPDDRFGTRYATWDYILALANRHYRSALYRRVYQRTEPGTLPYPAKGYSSAGKVWLPWGGTGAEVPGWLFMYGEELQP